MSAMRNIDQTDVICGLKAAVTALECHNMQILKEEKEIAKKCKTIQDTIHAEKKKLRNKPMCNIPLNGMHGPSMGIWSKCEKRTDRCKKISRLLFPEMRGGILYTRCCCLHRDGLQDYCPLSQCQGRAECLVKPWAICPPGKFVRLRYPELYPKASNTNC